MQSGRSDIRSSRQRPVSCHFCRSRKLRCSRRFPCPNCTSRGISCQLYASQPVEIQSENTTGGGIGANSTDILARLQRLEDIVLGKGDDVSRPVADPASSVAPEQPESPRGEQNATDDARWLELECSIQARLSSVIEPDKVVFRTCTIRQIKNATSILARDSSDVISSEDVTKCFWIPLYEESKCVVEKYLEDLTYLVHVIHIPSIRTMMDQLYQEIHMQRRPKPSHIVLLLSIIASTLYSWTSRDPGTLLSLTAEELMSRAFVFLKGALDLLEYSSRASDGLLLTAITGARDLRLHRLDQESDSDIAGNEIGDTVQTEIKRRVWWYLVATDWVLSHYEGPLKGTYIVHPRHMSVRKPRNIDDFDLLPGKVIVERHMDYPTDVSYTLQRIQLGEICRELTDSAPLFGPKHISYDSILANDKMIDDYIMGFPTFFRHDGGSLKDLAKINPHVTTGIIVQRYILNSLAHANRCKLHLPYFARGLVNPKYAYSRKICLEAARAIIRTERLFEKESISFFPTRFRFAGSVYCLCMAIIVFVLNVCVYKDDGQEEEGKRETADACSILQTAKNDSSIADRLLQSFMRVIRKHKVSIQGISNANAVENGAHPCSASLNTTDTSESSLTYEIPNLDEQSLLSPQSSYWNGISENFDSGMETIDWNALFFELDSQSFEGSLF
ncbi:hypothetical protein BJX76DRAFT_369430 [Aspergillus varians]